MINILYIPSVGVKSNGNLLLSVQTIIIPHPQALQEQVVDWYHLHLCHPGTTRTEATIKQHFYWKNL
jgi:hypothetical protein